MATESRSQLKTYFETGDRPTEQQFINFFDSSLNFLSDGVHVLHEVSGTTKIGIGQMNPAAKLDVNGDIKATNIQLTSGAAAGLVLTSDVNGNATWQVGTDTGATSLDEVTTGTGNNETTNDIIVGGITTDAIRLIVDDGTGAGKVLTSDADGVANWQDLPQAQAGTLQSVTDEGNITTNAIEVSGITVNTSDAAVGRVLTSDAAGIATWQDLPADQIGDLQTVTDGTGNVTTNDIVINAGLNICSDEVHTAGYKFNLDNGLAGGTNGIARFLGHNSLLRFDFKMSTGNSQLFMFDASNTSTIELKTNTQSTFANGVSMGSFQLTGAATTGHVLTTDASGNGTWAPVPNVGGDTLWKVGAKPNAIQTINESNTAANADFALAAGRNNVADGEGSFVAGGQQNNNKGKEAAILGGTANLLDVEASRSVILGGQNIEAKKPDTVYVPNLELFKNVFGKYTDQPEGREGFDDLTLITRLYNDKTPNAPYIKSVTNGSFQPSQSKTVTITGANFDNTTTVKVVGWPGELSNINVVSDKEITMFMAATTATGAFDVKLCNRQKCSNDSYTEDAGARAITVRAPGGRSLLPPNELPVVNSRDVELQQSTTGLGGTSPNTNFNNFFLIEEPEVSWQRGENRTFSFVWSQSASGTWAFGIGSDQVDPTSNQQQFEGEVLMYVLNNKIWGFYGGGGVSNWSQKISENLTILPNTFYKTIFHDDGGQGSLFEIFQVDAADFDNHLELVSSGIITSPANNLNLNSMGILNNSSASIAQIDLI